MDFILNELPDENQTKETIWIFKDKIDVYNKFNQISLNIPSVIQQLPQQLPIKELKEDEKTKVVKETPLDLIIKETSSAIIVKNEIKEKLIEFISCPEFSKAFGVKKSAEIISALTRDSWNQSMALFISFLFDANVIYKDKSYLFNKNKNLKEIPIMVK
jgi:hypothetical protein